MWIWQMPTTFLLPLHFTQPQLYIIKPCVALVSICSPCHLTSTGWQFNGSGTCTQIPQLPSDPPLNPNPKRSCVQSFPTRIAEDLLWVWGEAGPEAEVEAAAAPLPTLAPEIGQFGDQAYWSSKLFLEEGTYLGRWYQRYFMLQPKRHLPAFVDAWLLLANRFLLLLLAACLSVVGDSSNRY